jgi:hypothetical protein
MTNKKLSYEELLVHLSKDCEHVKLSCPLKCGKLLYRSEAQHHFLRVCNEARIQCEYCKEKFHPSKNDRHECVGRLKLKVRSLEAEVEVLRKRPEKDIIRDMVERMNIEVITDNYYRI